MTSRPDITTGAATSTDADRATDPGIDGAADGGPGDTIITSMQELLSDVAQRHHTDLDPALLREMAGAAAAVMLIEMASREAHASMLDGTNVQSLYWHMAATLVFQDAAAEVLHRLRGTPVAGPPLGQSGSGGGCVT